MKIIIFIIILLIAIPANAVLKVNLPTRDYCTDALNLQMTLLSSEFSVGNTDNLFLGIPEFSSEPSYVHYMKTNEMFIFFDNYPDKRKHTLALLDVIVIGDVFDWDILECKNVKTNPEFKRT